MMQDYKIVVVGASAGGLEALSAIIPNLPGDFPLPVVIVQHRRSDSDEFLVVHLDELSRLRVKEVDDKEPIRPGTVYLAPAGYHLLMEQNGTFALSLDERVNYCRPSIDVLFDSAADMFEDKVIGVILTGGNSDGSQGLKHVKQSGGLAIVQEPACAEADCMPREAIKATQVDQVLALEEIVPFLVRCCPIDETLRNACIGERRTVIWLQRD